MTEIEELRRVATAGEACLIDHVYKIAKADARKAILQAIGNFIMNNPAPGVDYSTGSVDPIALRTWADRLRKAIS